MKLFFLLLSALLIGCGPGLAEAPEFLVDRFGQSARKEFPGKVHREEELKADVETQAAALPRWKGPALDAYGGLAGSGERYGLQKSGFFHLGKAGGRDVLVTPDGNVFFHLGMCGISLSDDYTLVAGREQTYEWLPPHEGPLGSAWRPNTPGVVSFYAANWVRKFGKPFDIETWSSQAVARLRAWGFNSAGAFSTPTRAMHNAGFPYVSFLPEGKEYGVKMLPDRIGAAEVMDPFAPCAEEALGKAFAAKVAPKADDPYLIGYFQGNEQHFELLPSLIPRYAASKVAAKGRLVKMLREKYGDIAQFNAAWNPVRPFSGFEELKEAPLAIRSDAGAEDMRVFYQQYLEAYYSLIARVFHRFDSRHLLLGSRWTPGTANNEDAVRIGGRYLDVVSVNYYTYGIGRDFLRHVYETSGRRPVLLSEWYYSATGQGLGAHIELKDQMERALAYRNYVEQAAALPWVVGSEWFIYGDQSLTGRFFEGIHGEGNNTGFVNVADRPYGELVAGALQTHERIYDVLLGKTPPFLWDDPRFTAGSAKGERRVVAVPCALAGLKMDGSTTNWPGRPATPIDPSRLVLGNPNPSLRGDFRLCWDTDHLYFLIHVKDPTPMRNLNRPESLWNADAVELFLGAKATSDGGSMVYSDRHILLGAGETPQLYVCDHPEESASCRIVSVREVTGDGYVLEAAIPWSVLGVTPSAGVELLFDVAIDNSDDGQVRKQQLMWNGTAQNSGNRAGWGLARLVEN